MWLMRSSLFNLILSLRSFLLWFISQSHCMWLIKPQNLDLWINIYVYLLRVKVCFSFFKQCKRRKTRMFCFIFKMYLFECPYLFHYSVVFKCIPWMCTVIISHGSWKNVNKIWIKTWLLCTDAAFSGIKHTLSRYQMTYSCN